MQLADVRALISGGAGGIGRHVAQRLVENGASVAVGDIDTEGLAASAGLTPNAQGRFLRRSLDVTNEADVVSFVAWAGRAMGGANVIINNAGIPLDGLLVATNTTGGEVTKLRTEDWQKVLSVDLTGAMYFAREGAAKMVESGTRPGVIITMSSISRHGFRGQSAYSAAKSAVAAMTVTWAKELGPYGIRACALGAGPVETPMTTRGYLDEHSRARIIRASPVGRIGVPEDIWLAIRFCIECDYYNARVLDVDGGIGTDGP